MTQQPGEPTDPQQPWQPPSGQPPYGQSGYGQAPYGQAPYGQAPYGQPSYAPAGSDASQDRFLAGAAHWGALLAGLVTSGLLAWLVPLLIMTVKGPSSPFVRRQAVESLNFQITMVIWAVVAGLLLIVLVGFLLLPLVALWWLVFTIIGAVKANNGEDYRYPLIFRFVS